jgi:hypothetical protein
MSITAKIVALLFLLLLVAQAFRPARNVSSEPAGPAHVEQLYPPPAEVKAILERACYDCHSDHTRYPWYASVQPLGWWLAHHVNEGKRELNFSHFGELPPTRAARKLTKSLTEVERGEMPMPSYVWIHHDARLSPADVAAFGAWIRQARAKVSANAP